MPTIYLDGKYKEISVSALERLVPGRLRAHGFFETLRTDHDGTFLLSRHLSRLGRAVRSEGGPRLSLNAAREIIQALLDLNKLKAGRLRISIYCQSGRWHQSLVVQPFDPSTNQLSRKGLSVMISSRVHRPFDNPQAKSLDYQLFLRSFLEAKKKGYDEALLMDAQGGVVEGARSNLFWVKDHFLYTPALKSGCLAGITRQVVLNLGKVHQPSLRCRYAQPSIMDLSGADEVFVTNSILGIAAVVRINQNLIAKGRPGPLTRSLQALYNATVAQI